jgi:hypothetical protein
MKYIKIYENFKDDNYDMVLNNIINNYKFDYSIFDTFIKDAISTFLLDAAFFKNYNVCEYLIDYDNIDLNKVNDEGETTLNILSFQYGKNYDLNAKILKLVYKLIDNGADWNIIDKTDSYFLDWSNDLEDILKKKYPKKYKNYIIKRKANKFNL